MVELTDDAHRFLFTVAQAASDAVCGFLPASSSSPVQSTLALPRPPLPDDGEATGPHTRTLINALPPTVTIQMVDMAAIPAEGIKPEFMEAFNQIYTPQPGMGPPPPAMGGGMPPLIASHASSGIPQLVHPGMPPLMPSLSADSDHFDSLPPLEDCILPDLLGVEEGEGQRAGMQDEEDWDFEAALDYIFDSSRAGGPVSESEWFNTQQRAAYDSAADDDGEMDSPITYFYKDRLQRYAFSLLVFTQGKGERGHSREEEMEGRRVVRHGAMPHPSPPSPTPLHPHLPSPPLVCPLRVRFEEFVKGFLSMSVFHTAECWVARGQETIEPVRPLASLSLHPHPSLKSNTPFSLDLT